MKAPKPTLLQASMIIMLTVGMTNHVFILPALLQTAKRDAWISILLSAPFVFLLMVLILYVSRRQSSKPLDAWVKEHSGTFASYAFGIAASAFCLINAFSTLYETVIWTRINFLVNTPILFTSGLLMALCCYAASKGLRSIANASGIFLPITFLFGFTIALINTQYKDYSQLFPILENGFIPPLKGVVYSMAGSFELLLILFIQPGLPSRFKLWQLFLLAAIILGFTLGPLLGAITEFNPYEANLVRYPAYEEWRLATVGKFISQTDFLSIYQWLSGAFIRISLLLHVTVEMWHIKTVKNQGVAQLFIGVVFTLCMLMPLSDIWIHRLTAAWLYPVNLAFLTGAACLLAFNAWVKGRGSRTKHG